MPDQDRRCTRSRVVFPSRFTVFSLQTASASSASISSVNMFSCVVLFFLLPAPTGASSSFPKRYAVRSETGRSHAWSPETRT